MSRRVTAVACAVVVTALAISGCSASRLPNVPDATAATSSGQRLTVFAAASLEATFTQLGTMFETTHPGVRVTFSFAGSQSLAEQITQGAPADVFAAANESTMAAVTAARKNAVEPEIFATNQLAIAVPPGNPAGITRWNDLTRLGLKLVVCAPEVPCGAATKKIERATKTTLTPVSEEQSVTDVLGKVQAGEADAGLVYGTDVIAAGDTVEGIDFEESSLAINANPIVALRSSPRATLGQEFAQLVLGDQGQRVLAAAGFGRVKR